ncbi:MAG: hypothetical protein M1838_000213 [Thelocarpon superellum]|nr:MAG: hypothetical protein M1838_000213 [Thelocarpon superellum]
MLQRARGLDVDCVAFDLEDSVTPGMKAEARSHIGRALAQPRAPGVREQAVRINSVESGLAYEDLMAVLKYPTIDSIVIPKVNAASDVQYVADVIQHVQSTSSYDRPKPMHILALVESAKGLVSLPSICASSPYLNGLIFAAEDFALDLSLTRTPSLTEFLYARSAIVTACRAHDLPSAIDLVCTWYGGKMTVRSGEEGRVPAQRILEEESRAGKGLGFNGKQCIHPSQVEIVQRAFSPDEGELRWAVRVVVAAEKADAMGRGAWGLDGKMIDAPVVGKARFLVEKGVACGIDVELLRTQWKDQEPE